MTPPNPNGLSSAQEAILLQANGDNQNFISAYGAAKAEFQQGNINWLANAQIDRSLGLAIPVNAHTDIPQQRQAVISADGLSITVVTLSPDPTLVVAVLPPPPVQPPSGPGAGIATGDPTVEPTEVAQILALLQRLATAFGVK